LLVLAGEGVGPKLELEVLDLAGWKALGPGQHVGPGTDIFGEPRLDRIEGGAIDDRLVLAGVGRTAINHLADVEAVLEKMQTS
jgi:hypothetical protein